MLKDYVPLLLHILVTIGFASVALAMSFVVGKVGRRNPTKDTAYECGVRSDFIAQPRFSVRFYLVAMLFILFDIEIVFLYPWAVAFQRFVDQFGPDLLWNCLSFIGILLVGFFYAVRQGALDWGQVNRKRM